MGWMSEDSKHEGYVIGLISDADGEYRELTYRKDGHRLEAVPLRYICIGCECGWRSHRMLAPTGTDWSPCMVWLAHGASGPTIAGYEESARAIWLEHVKQSANAQPFLRMDVDAFNREHDREWDQRKADAKARQAIPVVGGTQS